MKMIIKGRAILSLMAILIILGGSFLPVFAGSDRYPTNTEVQQLRQEFHQKTVPQTRQSIKEGRGYGRDKRTPSDRENRASFIRAWSRVDPDIAPFIGEWQGQENWLIFPSNVRGRTCVIYLTLLIFAWVLYPIANLKLILMANVLLHSFKNKII